VECVSSFHLQIVFVSEERKRNERRREGERGEEKKGKGETASDATVHLVLSRGKSEGRAKGKKK